ncbi:uncharacterized protein AMSG_01469 [Thecamonas trahens ATCC 50062]|uniref:Uncharacterized protein n=1 Tax=Thecamonas trahens ATCC 50062 TaxID=461836 RepID=A0A0L0DQR2_THETB|nr:hypothetical protein AMSG_01469 [Thecamonas trahens ATCC 50062]KNC54615.1 hypothetical protein AMSG_01469 [Thecamonas trahens ATCC 50062]|eukprot:XP_013761522.1 hypothetical protein AMSG_01469 [Thecamonas trahens ATCC 50062]
MDSRMFARAELPPQTVLERTQASVAAAAGRAVADMPVLPGLVYDPVRDRYFALPSTGSAPPWATSSAGPSSSPTPARREPPPSPEPAMLPRPPSAMAWRIQRALGLARSSKLRRSLLSVAPLQGPTASVCVMDEPVVWSSEAVAVSPTMVSGPRMPGAFPTSLIVYSPQRFGMVLSSSAVSARTATWQCETMLEAPTAVLPSLPAPVVLRVTADEDVVRTGIVVVSHETPITVFHANAAMRCLPGRDLVSSPGALPEMSAFLSASDRNVFALDAESGRILRVARLPSRAHRVVASLAYEPHAQLLLVGATSRDGGGQALSAHDVRAPSLSPAITFELPRASGSHTHRIAPFVAPWGPWGLSTPASAGRFGTHGPSTASLWDIRSSTPLFKFAAAAAEGRGTRSRPTALTCLG